VKYRVVLEKYTDFICSIKEYFMRSHTILFQERNTIKRIEYEKHTYVIKSFKIPHLLNQIVYRFFRASKAERSYENSIRLVALGVNTPKPIGYSEFPSLLLFKESYYISEFYDFDFEIRAVLSDMNFEDRETILKNFVAFSYDLHNKGVYHVDYSPGNVIIKKLEEGYEFAIIDVNRMKFIVYDDEMRFKNLSRFSTSDEDLEFIAKNYAKVSDIDEAFAIKTLWKYHNEHQQYLVNKKRLKALKKKK
jgi:hypothetical protein